MSRSRHASNRGPGYRLRGIHGRVVSSIGEAIVRGRYAPGSLLPREPELIAKFDVSRTALREALKVLAAKGLVETRQRVGTRVRPQEQWNHFDPEITTWQLGNGFRSSFVRDLIEFRQINEPAAARFAAKRATARDMVAIAAALAAMEAGAATEDSLAYAEADARFHICVFLASHNNLMASLSFTIRQILETTFKLYQAATKTARSYGFAEDLAFHRRVFEKIGRRQPEAAAKAMSRLVAAAEHDLTLVQAKRRSKS
jgi:DNA-binding FadR family transcriptional regulator